MQLSCFNIIPGVAFVLDSSYSFPDNVNTVWIATTKITRDDDHEVIHVVCRSNNLNNGGKPRSFTFDWGKGDTVELVGICVNPNDLEDLDWGVEPGDLPEVTEQPTVSSPLPGGWTPVQQHINEVLTKMEVGAFLPAGSVTQISTSIYPDNPPGALDVLQALTQGNYNRLMGLNAEVGGQRGIRRIS